MKIPKNLTLTLIALSLTAGSLNLARAEVVRSEAPQIGTRVSPQEVATLAEGCAYEYQYVCNAWGVCAYQYVYICY